MKRSGRHVLRGGRQPNMRCTHPSPATGNGQKHSGKLFDKRGLLLRGEHQISVALTLRGQRGEDFPAHAEVRRTHVGMLLCTFQAEHQSSKVLYGHECLSCFTVSMTKADETAGCRIFPGS